MILEEVFVAASLLVLPAWLLLAFAPRWSWTDRVVQRIWIPALIGLCYLTVLLAKPAVPPGADMKSVAGLTVLFSSPHAALMAWLHFLAFDLFTAAWQVRDARRLGIRHRYVVPCLIFTFMLGPIGLLFYFIVRWVAGGGIYLREASRPELSGRQRASVEWSG